MCCYEDDFEDDIFVRNRRARKYSSKCAKERFERTYKRITNGIVVFTLCYLVLHMLFAYVI